jgi:Asp-tRNA(Asn)/Glu-tRNA(Gln) amidotransferase A subunit family amidase
LKADWARLLEGFDAAITPAATGPAPPFQEGTGSPVCALTWSVLGVPAVSVPLLESHGLPLGIQVVGASGGDRAVLASAHWLLQDARG